MMNVKHRPGKVCGYSEPCDCHAEALEVFAERALEALCGWLCPAGDREQPFPGVAILDDEREPYELEIRTLRRRYDALGLDVIIEDPSGKVPFGPDAPTFDVDGFEVWFDRDEETGQLFASVIAREED